MAFMEDTIKLIQHRITPMDSEHKDININRTFHRDDYKSLDTILRLLQRLEKFEEMWGELEVYVEQVSPALSNKMNILWQKYIIKKGGK